MKTVFKKSVAVMLAVLIFVSAGIAGLTASAKETEGTLSFETKFFRYNEALGDWDEVSIVNKGDNLKARVYVDTDYFTNSGELLFFYNNDFFEVDYQKNEILEAAVNPYYEQACNMEGQIVVFGDGHQAINRMIEQGTVTAEFASKHTGVAMLYMFGIQKTNMKLDGEEWLFEFNLTVKEDAQGTSGDFFVLESTVMTPENEHGFVNVPFGKEGEYVENTEALFGVDIDINVKNNPVSLETVPEEEKFTLTLNANGGTFADGTEIMTDSLAEGEEAYLPDDLTKTGYAFAGWTGENGEAVDSFVMPSQDTELVANWAPAGDTAYTVNTYLMKFDGVTYDVEQELCYGTTDESVQVVPEEIEGFTFDESKSETETVILPDGTAEINLYYTRNQYDFTTYVDGEFFAQYSYLYGETVTETDIPRKVGYNFVEWVIKGTENKVVFPIEMPAENLELEAVYETAEFTATFNTDGGNEIEPVTVRYGEDFVLPSATKTGYSFAFWRDSNGAMYGAGQTVTMPANNVEFKAVWLVQSYSVTYIIGKNTVKFDVVPGETLPQPDMSAYENIEFLNWVDGNGRIATPPEVMPENNLTFYAKFNYIYVDETYGITISFLNDCFDYYGEDLTFTVEKKTFDKASGGINVSGKNYKQLERYYIGFRYGSTPIQPKASKSVLISVPVPVAYKDGTNFLFVYYYEENTTHSKIDAIKNGNSAAFRVSASGEFEVCVETGATVKTLPSKTSYFYKEALDLSGLAFEMLGSNGEMIVVTDTSKMNVTGYNPKKIGVQTVTVECDGASSQFNVSVSYAWWQTLIRILLLGFLWY